MEQIVFSLILDLLDGFWFVCMGYNSIHMSFELFYSLMINLLIIFSSANYTISTSKSEFGNKTTGKMNKQDLLDLSSF